MGWGWGPHTMPGKATSSPHMWVLTCMGGFWSLQNLLKSYGTSEHTHTHKHTRVRVQSQGFTDCPPPAEAPPQTPHSESPSWIVGNVWAGLLDSPPATAQQWHAVGVYYVPISTNQQIPTSWMKERTAGGGDHALDQVRVRGREWSVRWGLPLR